MRFTEPVFRPNAATLSPAPHHQPIIAKSFLSSASDHSLGLDDFSSKSFSMPIGPFIQAFSGGAAQTSTSRKDRPGK
ncbi:hypothetical protein [Bradyrhizobium sp. AUGA SZCCT0182]|uniref:hypothetical protein n=1 Tax=Bradyrhizobium sp. AUGA SZCCT0182 TaxID=2807667 RepID=UPI001BA86217|nr:hypothetical protein [Bradyrhizobium sp. AUGA SZCCT0182]MBR1231767.1 hypothetical protein [Bradyrhizobium sp. AUGA SZCCT0182]